MQRVVVDPVTRIEGHLRIEAEIENGIIKDAFSSGTMVRGIEIIARDRDPREVWAYVGRVCGVCTSIHSLCSVRSVENALGIKVPPNAERVRSLMQIALTLQDHITHFYQLQGFDWIDVVSALKADPSESAAIAQSMSDWDKNSAGYFKDVQQKIKAFVNSGSLGIFANGYWGNPLYRLPPAVNLIGTAHYLDALDIQKEIVKVQTIFGGKNPHPNYLVGGMACAVDPDSPNAVNMERLSFVAGIIEQGIDFVDKVYLPDVLAIASYYPEWMKYGGGVANYLSYGDYPVGAYGETSTYKAPRGIVMDRNLTEVAGFDPYDMDGLKEFVYNSWYDYTAGQDKGLHPSVGETSLRYSGPRPPYSWLGGDNPYSWIKTPRYRGAAMETGPLARFAVGLASGRDEYREVSDRCLKQLGAKRDALFSTMGRILARAMEASIIAAWQKEFYISLVENIKSGDWRMFNGIRWEPDTWPESVQGVGLAEAPRGSLAHYVSIRDKRVSNYQMVVPTTWNASPRDPDGGLSPFEASLIGTPVADTDVPLEILRTIHSFDPCMACAVHAYDETGEHIHRISVL